MRSVPAALTACTAAMLLAGPAPAPAFAADAAFYAPPSQLPAGGHGTLIRSQRVPATDPTALPGASRTTLVLHRGAGSTVVSGLVSVPRGKAPRGGWPVVTYAHGTSGIADRCAPSRDDGSSAVSGYHRYVFPLLTRWLKRGYAVVRTDYAGLGTPGEHPYLVGRSQGAAVLDVVRAARRLDRRVGKRLIVAGHSQGGHAALWAGSMARSYTPELQLRGTVAYAPASNLADQVPLAKALTGPGGGLSALIGMIARGLDVATDLAPATFLSDTALGLYPATLQDCVGDLAAPASWGGVAPAALLREGADLTPLVAALRANGPETLRFGKKPVWIGQGDADGTVLPPFTQSLVQKLRAGGATALTSRTYAGVDHGGIVKSAAKGSTDWIAKRLK